ncbi:hypothetical protein WJX73_009002 [Symbiochloris irregularis]|uniref:MEKHLA domain-containing protein n=1 Tax=Symbiochloris irregularis TaxID=706552 RepID=A0AAW1PUH0_9CHLO
MQTYFTSICGPRLSARLYRAAQVAQTLRLHRSSGVCSCSCSRQQSLSSDQLRPVLHTGLPINRRLHFDASAKKKGKGGGGQKKGPGSVIDIPKSEGPEAAGPSTAGPSKEPWEQTDVVMINLLLIENYRRAVGRPMMEGNDIMTLAKDLYEAPFALLFHDAFVSEEPQFMYANQTALDLFQSSWEELIGTPSKESASQDAQPGRQQLLDETAEKGFIHISNARRRGRQGREFDIVEAELFNVEGPDGNKVGQATVIHHWKFDDGTEAGPHAPEVPVSQEMLDQANKAVEEQSQTSINDKDGRSFFAGVETQSGNYRRLIGRPLLEGSTCEQLPKQLYEAPFPLLFHDHYVSAEPRFLYANQAALTLFQTSQEEFIGSLSKDSATEDNQSSRRAAMQEVEQTGFLHIKSARRHGKKGRDFDILDAELFNVEGPEGKRLPSL